MPLFGPPNVEKLKATRNVNGLIKALGYQKDYNVRIAAAKALGQIGDVRAVKPLVAALEDDVRSLCDAATMALERIGASATEPLIGALQVRGARRYAARILGNIGDPRAVEPLIAVLSDRQEHAAFGGGAWDMIRSNIDISEALEARKNAAEALGKIGDPRAVEPLIAALESESGRLSGRLPDVLGFRPAAIKALGDIGDQRAVKPLTDLLKHRDDYVRKVAKQALERLISNIAQ